jgi:hypothetical protein
MCREPSESEQENSVPQPFQKEMTMTLSIDGFAVSGSARQLFTGAESKE